MVSRAPANIGFKRLSKRLLFQHVENVKQRMFDDKFAILSGTLRIVQNRAGKAADRLFHPLIYRERFVIQRRFHF